MQQVDEAQRRIQKAVPDALISRGDYDWSLSVAPANKSCGIIVFEHFDDGRFYAADVDAVIAELKKLGSFR